MNSTQSFLSAIAKTFQLSVLTVLILSTACTPKATVSEEVFESSTAEISREDAANEDVDSEVTASEESESSSVLESSPEPDIESDPSEVAMTFSETAVGGINAETRFDVAVIQDLFPELAVTESVKSAEGSDYPIIVVSEGGENVLTLDANVDNSLVRTVLIEGTQVSNASGDNIGDTFSDIFEEDISRNCFVGTDGVGENRVICPAPATQNISYFFEGDWSQQGLTEIPPIEKLNSAPLRKILWISRNS